jgi:uncharacterized protein
MLVNIEEIGDAGLELDEPIRVEFLQEALAHQGEETGFRPLHSARLKASLQRLGGGVLLRGDFRLEVAAPCKRCLAEATMSLPVSFTLNLIPRQLLHDEDAGEVEDDERVERSGSFRLEDADREVFEGKTIDLDPILREQVLLALPMNLLCGETCQGLCPMCGENLNLKQCGCERQMVDPRWMALKNIKLN